MKKKWFKGRKNSKMENEDKKKIVLDLLLRERTLDNFEKAKEITGYTESKIWAIVEERLEKEQEWKIREEERKEKFDKLYKYHPPPFLVRKAIYDSTRSKNRRYIYHHQLDDEPYDELDFIKFVERNGDGKYAVLDKNCLTVKNIYVTGYGFKDPSELENEDKKKKVSQRKKEELWTTSPEKISKFYYSDDDHKNSDKIGILCENCGVGLNKSDYDVENDEIDIINGEKINVNSQYSLQDQDKTYPHPQQVNKKNRIQQQDEHIANMKRGMAKILIKKVDITPDNQTCVNYIIRANNLLNEANKIEDMLKLTPEERERVLEFERESSKKMRELLYIEKLMKNGMNRTAMMHFNKLYGDPPKHKSNQNFSENLQNLMKDLKPLMEILNLLGYRKNPEPRVQSFDLHEFEKVCKMIIEAFGRVIREFINYKKVDQLTKNYYSNKSEKSSKFSKNEGFQQEIILRSNPKQEMPKFTINKELLNNEEEVIATISPMNIYNFHPKMQKNIWKSKRLKNLHPIRLSDIPLKYHIFKIKLPKRKYKLNLYGYRYWINPKFMI